MSFKDIRIGETDRRHILNGRQITQILADYAVAAQRRHDAFWGKASSTAAPPSSGYGVGVAVLRQKID